MADFIDRYQSFYDPFAEGNLIECSDVFPEALSFLHIDAPPPYSNCKTILSVDSAALEATGGKVLNDLSDLAQDTLTGLDEQATNVAVAGITMLSDIADEAFNTLVSSNVNNQGTAPAALAGLTASNASSNASSTYYHAQTTLAIRGQGTAIANCKSPERLLFTLSTDDSTQLSLYTQVTEHSVDFWYGPSPPTGATGFLPDNRNVIKGDVRVEVSSVKFLYPPMDRPVRYWLSVDYKNGILRFGRDFTSLSFTLYEARLKKEESGVSRWIDEKYAFIAKLSTVAVQQEGGNLKAPTPFQLVAQPLPIVEKLPPIIVSSDSITLDQLAVGSATVPANLSAECQRLYANVAGAGVTLDTADFPDFSKAIERSVNTKDLLCWELLKKKGAKQFGYLRITLGADLGNSPGAPYVLEIWPAMHSSRIHDHGNTHAVIKVLHGKIKAFYFTTLHDAQQLGPPANLEKGDITWIDPENYQVHMLSNESRDGSVCCTIQCYSYGANDTRHYEVFDYILDKSDSVIHQFQPNSDMRFDDFKAAIKKEWNERPDKSA